jgi:hypothetical protein
VSPKPRSKDLVLVHGRSEDGGMHVLRSREDRIESGVMRPLEQGRPIHGEVVKLKQRPECPLLFDAETQLADAGKPAPESRASNGPAQVASDAYRKNYDAIWGRAKRPSELPN